MPAKRTSAKLIVQPADDAIVERPKTVTVTISPSTTYNIGVPDTVTVTIADNE